MKNLSAVVESDGVLIYRPSDHVANAVYGLALQAEVSPAEIYTVAAQVLNFHLQEVDEPVNQRDDACTPEPTNIWTDSSVSFTSLLNSVRSACPAELDIHPQFSLTPTPDSNEFKLKWLKEVEQSTRCRLEIIAEQLTAILEQALSNPYTAVAEFSLVTHELSNVLPNPMETLATTAQSTCIDMFARAAEQHSEVCAVSDSSDAWTYRELDEMSNQIAGYLLNHGVTNGDFIAIYADRSACLPLAILGTLKAGAAFVILDPAYPAAILKQRIEKAQPRGYIALSSAGEFPPKNSMLEIERPGGFCLTLGSTRDSMQNGPLSAYKGLAPIAGVTPNSIAYMAFTSGSTSESKAVIGTHSPIAHFLDWHIKTFGLNGSDRFAMLAGLAHDPLIRDIFTPLILGATLFVPDPHAVGFTQRLFGWLIKNQVTVLHLSPALGDLLSAAYEAETKAYSKSETESDPLNCTLNVRYAFFGGDKLTDATVNGFLLAAPGATCVNLYGATETPQAMSYHIVETHGGVSNSAASSCVSSRRPPIGRGIADVQMLVLNPAGKLCGVGEPGEIHIRTAFLTEGYVGDPAKTQISFLGDSFGGDSRIRIYRTGDKGMYRLDGAIDCGGRVDDQVKVNGFRMNTGDVEHVLRMHPEIKGAVVVVRGASSQERQLVAYIVTLNGVELTRGELVGFMKTRLPAHMIPARFVGIESLPLTPNGKIDRRALPEAGTPRQASSFRSNDDAISSLESRLIPLWEETLSITNCRPGDDFFEMGGNSLRAVSLLSKVEREFGVFLTLSSVLEAPTVHEMAGVLQEQLATGKTKSGPIALKRTGSKRPLFCMPAAGGGSPMIYRSLANHVAEDQPVYVMQPCGVDGEEAPCETVEEMAAKHIQEMRVIQPAGPYVICGLSLGGTIAYEVAQQLRAMGETVERLFLFDTQAKCQMEEHWTFKQRVKFRVLLHMENVSQSQGLVSKTKYINRIVMAAAGKIRRREATFCAAWKTRIARTIHNIKESQEVATVNYTPLPYCGNVILFRARVQRPWRENDASLGWEPLVKGTLEIVPAPGTHFSMLNEPCVGFIGRKLSEYLEQCETAEAAIVRREDELTDTGQQTTGDMVRAA